MIYLLILIDIFIYNYTTYKSYYFITYLFNKPYKYFLLTGLILDFIVFDTILLNTIILTIIYFINKIFKDINKDNIYNYIFINTFNYFFYLISTNLIYLNSITNILNKIGYSLIINITFIILLKIAKKTNK